MATSPRPANKSTNGGSKDKAKAQLNYLVFGTITYQDGQPAATLQVTAYDKDESGSNLLGQATSTDASGNYTIAYSDADFRKSSSERGGADIIVCVYNDRQELLFKSKKKNNAPPKLELNITLPEKQFMVHGKVSDANQKPQVNLLVRAFDRDLRKEQPLGECLTGLDGSYRISYHSDAFARAEKAAADLVVKLFDDGDKPLATSDIHFNAPAHVEINLSLPAVAAEYEWIAILHAVTPLLMNQASNGELLLPWDLTESDLDFLVAESGLQREYLRWWVLSITSAREYALGNPELIDPGIVVNLQAAGTPLPVEGELEALAFYGWFRKGLPELIDSLRLERATHLRQSLLDAATENIIPALPADWVESVMDALDPSSASAVKTVIANLELVPQKALRLRELIDDFTHLTTGNLPSIASSAGLDEAESDRLGLAASLHNLTQGHADTIALGLKMPFKALGGPARRSVDLAQLQIQDWANLLTEAGAQPRDGDSLAEMAVRIEDTIAGSLPTASMLRRASTTPTTLAPALKVLDPQTDVLKKISHLPVGDATALQLLGELPEEQQLAYEQVRKAVSAYPGIPMKVPMSRVQEAVHDLTQALALVCRLNPDRDLLQLDYSMVSGEVTRIEFGDMPDEQQTHVVVQLKVMQKVLTIAQHPSDAVKLVQAGLHSAVRTALSTRGEMIAAAGLTRESANRCMARARTISQQTVHAWMAVQDFAAHQKLIRGKGAVELRADAQVTAANWAELFGNLAQCDCSHCQSMLSPAAYFVDLMHYIEKHILEPTFGQTISDPRHLQQRRGDLWDRLELTCRNTNDVIPTLDIVNEVLEHYLLSRQPFLLNTAGLFSEIATSTTPGFKIPVCFPLQRLEILLAHFGLSRDRVAQLLDLDRSYRVRTKLGLNRHELARITNSLLEGRPLPDAALLLEQLFPMGGAALPRNDANTLIMPFDLTVIQRATSIERDIVRQLLLSSFVSRDGSHNAAVELHLGTVGDGVQNSLEQVANLSLRRLDRLAQLVRLWRVLPWTVDELDYVLLRIATRHDTLLHPVGQAPVPVVLGTTFTLPDMLEILDLCDITALVMEEVMVLWDEWPVQGFRGQAPLFDRRFNTSPFPEQDGRWPEAIPEHFTHPGFSIPRGTSTPDRNVLARLTGALGLGEADLVELVRSLRQSVVDEHDSFGDLRGLPLVSNELDLRLSKNTLAVLYRHALIARVTGFAPARLVEMVRLVPTVRARAENSRYLFTRSDVFGLFKLIKWLAHSPYSWNDVRWLANGQVPLGWIDSKTLATDMVARVASENAGVFPESVFTAIGLTTDQSVSLVSRLQQSQPPLIRSASPRDGYALALDGNFSLSEPTIAAACRDLFDFDLVNESVMGLAIQLESFTDDALAILLKSESVTTAQSMARQLVAANLGQFGNANRAFIELSPARLGDQSVVPPVDAQPAKYGVNPAYWDSVPRSQLVAPADLAERIVRSEIAALNVAGTGNAIPETLFTSVGLTLEQSRRLVAVNIGSAFIHGTDGRSILINPQAPATVETTDFHKPVLHAVMKLLGNLDPWSILDRSAASAVNCSADLSVFARNEVLPKTILDLRELFGLTTETPTLIKHLDRLRHWSTLQKAPGLDLKGLRFTVQNWQTHFNGGADFGISTETLRATSSYGYWLRPRPGVDPLLDRREALNRVVAGTNSSDDLAEVLGTRKERIDATANLETLKTGPWYEKLSRWSALLEVLDRLGVSGETIVRLGLSEATETEPALWRAADDIDAAIHSKYADPAIFREKTESFQDLIRARRRDALLAYTMTKYPELDSPAKLSAYLLLDVESGGCSRTSRLVAGTASLQLYVQRVSIGAEAPAQFHEAEWQAQWAWRKNYRVWEANRKVFLQPEAFIEPDLRDDKTPLFQNLEGELLQRKITAAEAEEAYAGYLKGYVEVAGLKIVGAFHDTSEVPVRDVLHLVGVTSDEPPQHYLREVYNIERSQTRNDSPVSYGSWVKLTAQIPVKWVSPVVFQRKLMLFWNEIISVPTTLKIKRDSYFDGYEHKYAVKWIERKPNGSWSSAQQLKFLATDGTLRKRFVDPLVLWYVDTHSAAEVRALYRNILVASSDPEALDSPIPIPSDFTANLRLEPLVLGLNHYPNVSISPYVTKLEDIQNGKTALEQLQEHRHQGAALDGYTAAGWAWERVFPLVCLGSANTPASLQIAAMHADAHGYVDWSTRAVPFVSFDAFEGMNSRPSSYAQYPLAVSGSTVVADSIGSPMKYVHFSYNAESQLRRAGGNYQNPIARFPGVLDALVINRPISLLNSAPSQGLPIDVLVWTGELQGLCVWNASREKILFYRLSTTTGNLLLERLQGFSVSGLLDPAFQARELKETGGQPLPGGATVGFLPQEDGTAVNFSGAWGGYLREVFFHVPHVVANHLNGERRYAEAQRWYHYIFNPFNPEAPWNYREFRALSSNSLRDELTDPAALAAYRNDPFNPHAIARLRLSAYQKAIVMKYIDNLLDWGDELFEQFTMESINEALMLYVLASDILGERAQELPTCTEEQSRTYADLKPLLSDTSDFLIEELETFVIVGQIGGNTSGNSLPVISGQANSDTLLAGPAVGEGAAQTEAMAAGFPVDLPIGKWASTGGTPLAELYGAGPQLGESGEFSTGGSRQYVVGNVDIIGDMGGKSVPFGRDITLPFDPPTKSPPGGLPYIDGKYTFQDQPPKGPPHFGDISPPEPNLAELVPARTIFCLPARKDLLACFDRVEDRLFKLRHCMDIAGVRRSLELFAPEIDPALLVRMKSAGLSLDEVLDADAGHAPPYRFAFLIEKARQYASSTQGLGAALLSAMEKRDGEELAALRTVHEQHLLDMRTQLMHWESDSANSTVQGLTKQKEAAQYRQDHYQSLLDSGLSGWEVAQQIAGITATDFGVAASLIDFTAAVVGYIPEVHTPTMVGATVETGGMQIANALSRNAAAYRSLASVFDWTGKAAGTQASFERRAEEWRHQVEMAKFEIAQLDKQIEAAAIRAQIADRSTQIHQRSMEQTQEVYDFYREKFTSLGLYNWMSTQLHRLHRLSFNSAWTMARMAERALHFERPELVESVVLGASPWAPDRAGLLAGEALQLTLQRLELGHLQTNVRQLEVGQSFSLAQFAPDRLIALRETGHCSFDIPELFFDLTFPGHYFRRIKAVRLSIPCVVGPYTSVGATLKMTRSQVRTVADAATPLAQVPLHNVQGIATSSAQGDPGVFEFTFRDERWLPFEGMGAISSWQLGLPQAVRGFDYQTISDVVLRVDYTAHSDESLRAVVDDMVGGISDRLRSAAPKVMLSLRHEFPVQWARLQQSVADSDENYNLELPLHETHYPFWQRSRLHMQESVQVHALFDHARTGPLSVTLNGGKSIELTPQSLDDATVDDVWWSGEVGHKVPTTNSVAPTLRLSVDDKSMRDIIVILGPN